MRFILRRGSSPKTAKPIDPSPVHFTGTVEDVLKIVQNIVQADRPSVEA